MAKTRMNFRRIAWGGVKQCLLVSQGELKRAMQRLDGHTTMGLDGIPAVLLKKIGEQVQGVTAGGALTSDEYRRDTGGLEEVPYHDAVQRKGRQADPGKLSADNSDLGDVSDAHKCAKRTYTALGRE